MEGLEEHLYRFQGMPTQEKRLSRVLDLTGKKGDTYQDNGTNCQGQVKTLKNGASSLHYTYDENGNIRSIRDSAGTSTYQYDELNQLIREDSHVQKKTFTYTYDQGGNLTAVKEYAYTIGELPASPVKTETGSFAPGWKDQMTGWAGTALTYDGCGNLTKKGSVTYTWNQGRKLTGVNNGKAIQYAYDHTGMRTKKVVAGVTTEYHLAGKLLLSEYTSGQAALWYHYDSAGNLVSVTMGGKDYYYVRNLQNDVIALVDDAGSEVVHYTYDSWGKPLSVTGSLKDTIGKQNPFRYRGYYYDSETGMYYLQSRYYDPQIRRFISTDGQINGALLGGNLYAYCENNPTNKTDEDGHISVGFSSIGSSLLAGAVKAVIAAVASAVVGAVTGIIVSSSRTSERPAWSYTPRSTKPRGWSSSKANDNFLTGIAGQYGNFKCVEAATAMMSALKAKRQHGKLIEGRVVYNGDYIPTYIWSESRGMNISKNGRHRGIEYEGKIYCNVHPGGLPVKIWKADFISPFGELQYTETEF